MASVEVQLSKYIPFLSTVASDSVVSFWVICLEEGKQRPVSRWVPLRPVGRQQMKGLFSRKPNNVIT
jgi:hypothetical protein